MDSVTWAPCEKRKPDLGVVGKSGSAILMSYSLTFHASCSWAALSVAKYQDQDTLCLEKEEMEA